MSKILETLKKILSKKLPEAEVEALIAELTIASGNRWMLNAGAIYGDLVESAFDLHRTALYKSLRFPLPKNPTEEQQTGRVLTDYLWRGFTVPELSFENPEKKEGG